VNVTLRAVFTYRILIADVCRDSRFTPTLSHALQDQVTHRIQVKDSVSGDVQNSSSVGAGGCAYSVCQLLHGGLSVLVSDRHGLKAHYLTP